MFLKSIMTDLISTISEAAKIVFLSKLLLPFLNFEQLCNFRFMCKRMKEAPFPYILDKHYFVLKRNNLDYLNTYNIKHVMLKNLLSTNDLQRLMDVLSKASIESIYLQMMYRNPVLGFKISRSLKDVIFESRCSIQICRRTEEKEKISWEDFNIIEHHFVYSEGKTLVSSVNSKVIYVSAVLRSMFSVNQFNIGLKYLKTDRIGKEILPVNIEELHVQTITTQAEINMIPSGLKILAIDVLNVKFLDFRRFMNLRELYIMNGKYSQLINEKTIKVVSKSCSRICIDGEEKNWIRRDYCVRESPKKRLPEVDMDYFRFNKSKDF